jgi:MFS family permease
MGSALNPVNSSLIATALVPIAAAMHVSVGRIAVLVSALYLASSIAQPTAGKLSEEFGPRRVFLAGIGLVLAGGVVGGVGQNLTTLIAARVLIGVGTSAGYPSAMLLIRRAGQAGLDKPPGGVLGGLQIAGAATAALGLPFGGVLVGAWAWRATFLVNVPVALATLVMALLGIPRDAPVTGSRRARGRSGPHRRGRHRRVRRDDDGSADIPDVGAATGLGRPGPGRRAGRRPALVGTSGQPPVPRRAAARLERGTHPHLPAVGADRAVRLHRALRHHPVDPGRPGPVRQRSRPAPAAHDRRFGDHPGADLEAQPDPRPADRRGRGLPGRGGRGPVPDHEHADRLDPGRYAGVRGGPGTAASGNQTALYTQVAADQLGTASGLFRTFGYVGSIASSAIISIVFHKNVGDHGLHVIAVIMIAASAVTLLVTVADRRLRTSSPDPKENL